MKEENLVLSEIKTTVSGEGYLLKVLHKFLQLAAEPPSRSMVIVTLNEVFCAAERVYTDTEAVSLQPGPIQKSSSYSQIFFHRLADAIEDYKAQTEIQPSEAFIAFLMSWADQLNQQLS